MRQDNALIVFFIGSFVEQILCMVATMLFVWRKITGAITCSWWFVLVPALCYMVFAEQMRFATLKRTGRNGERND